MNIASHYKTTFATGRSFFFCSKIRSVLTVVIVTVLLTLLTGYAYWPRSPIDLAQGRNMDKSGLYASWKNGDVVVLVRHGERCDRSSNECLGPADGITINGSAVSADLGRAFNRLGLAQTDVISSPTTRTVQTAESMFGSPVSSQDWLYNCDKTLLDAAMSHKASNRNLILVTHSGCFSHLESQHGYPHASTSEYDSALFISLDSKGRPVIQGILNPEDWKQLTQQGSH